MFEIDDLLVCRKCGILFSKKATTSATIRCPNCDSMNTEGVKFKSQIFG